MQQNNHQHMRSQKHLKPSFNRAITEGNIRISSHSTTHLPRPRLNTIQNEQDFALRPSKNSSSKHLKGVSPLKFYQSKICLSCESWSAYSMQQKKYKRGYRPTKTVQFNGFVRLIILKIYLKLQRQYPQIATVMVRTNRYLLFQQLKQKGKSLVQQKKLQKLSQKKQDPFLLAQNTTIALKNLILGNFYTQHPDVNQYCVIFIGALLKEIQNGSSFSDKLINFDPPIKEGLASKERKSSLSLFFSFANDLLQSQNYSSTKISPNYELLSTPEQMTRILSDLIVEYPQFTTIVDKRELICSIKFQLGYKFFEERKIKFAASWPLQEDHLILKYKGRPNFDILCYNKLTSNVIAMNDCKYSMEDIDLRRVEKLLSQLAKPIVNKQKQKANGIKLPVLKLSQS